MQEVKLTGQFHSLKEVKLNGQFHSLKEVKLTRKVLCKNFPLHESACKVGIRAGCKRPIGNW